jgi:hypothetical protein
MGGEHTGGGKARKEKNEEINREWFTGALDRPGIG